MWKLGGNGVPEELGEMPNFDLCGAFFREAGMFGNIDADTETTESSKNR